MEFSAQNDKEEFPVLGEIEERQQRKKKKVFLFSAVDPHGSTPS
jgi:hypothetical protein